MNRIIRASTFAGLLGVHRSTLVKWHAIGRLRYDFSDPGLDDHYYERTLDGFLASCKYSGDRVFHYDDLASGRITLLTRQEVQELSGMSHGAFRTRLGLGHLEGMLAQHYWQITQASFERYMHAVQYTPAMVGHIIGIAYGPSRDSMYKLLRAGVLVRHPFSLVSGIYITEESIDAYLADHMPHWGIPSEWREERLQDPRLLLTAAKIANHLNRPNDHGVRLLLGKERLSCIWRPGKTIRLYSPTAFDTYMDLERRPTDAEIAHWFGVHFTTISRWRGRGLVHCPLSQHQHQLYEPLYEACWQAIIEGQVTPGIHAYRWITMRKRSRYPLLGRMLAAAELGISPDEVVLRAEMGQLKGIRTLAGEWRFSRSAVHRYKHAL